MGSSLIPALWTADKRYVAFKSCQLIAAVLTQFNAIIVRLIVKLFFFMFIFHVIFLFAFLLVLHPLECSWQSGQIPASSAPSMPSQGAPQQSEMSIFAPVVEFAVLKRNAVRAVDMTISRIKRFLLANLHPSFSVSITHICGCFSALATGVFCFHAHFTTHTFVMESPAYFSSGFPSQCSSTSR